MRPHRAGGHQDGNRTAVDHRDRRSAARRVRTPHDQDERSLARTSYWSNRAASGLYRTIRETMPQGREGTIGPAASADLVAFLLRENGAEATGEFGTDVETLDGQRTCFRQ